MKKGIHPPYGDAVVRCACGNFVQTGSTVAEMKIEICSACHPFYTGKKKIVDSAGQVDRFMKRFKKTTKIKEQITAAHAKKKPVAKKNVKKK